MGLNKQDMNFNKENKEKQNPLTTFNSFLVRNGMNMFLSKTLIIWCLIFLAFWLGNACVGISKWEDISRWAMVAVMIISWFPIAMSNSEDF